MNNLSMFCLSMESKHLNIIKEFGYLPVGLGKENFSEDWFVDNKGKNISEKNKYYGEYTFHYWLWKNYLDKIEEGWIGFCQYRKFWSEESGNLLPNSLNELKPIVLKKIPKDYENFEVILGEESSVSGLKTMKFLKRGFGRTTDHVSQDVRAGLMTRSEGFDIIKQYDGKKPNSLKLYLKKTGLTEKEFYSIMNKHKVNK